MKLVLDTNVLVAAFISEGVCHELLEHCFLHHEVYLSNPILNELSEVLKKKFGYSQTETDSVTQLLKTRTHLVTPEQIPVSVCRDSDDDWILATAIEGGCTLILTGDKDLLEIGEFKGVRIIRPSDFRTFESGSHE